jgi:hypothetical protein
MSKTKTGVPDWEEFYTVIGQAPSEWHLVEGEMGHIFSVVVGNPDGALANAAYYSIQSFKLRLSMVNATAAVFLRNHPALQTEWSALYKDACSLNKIRNRLAHYIVVLVENKSKTKKKAFLKPSIFDFRYVFNENEKYSIRQIKSWSQQFETLHKALRKFNGSIPRR